MYHCNKICSGFKGYENGYRSFAIRGNKYCAICEYQIPTRAIRCSCCHAPYRYTARDPYSREYVERKWLLLAEANVIISTI